MQKYIKQNDCLILMSQNRFSLGKNQTVQQEGVIALAGSTRMDKHGNISIQRGALRGFMAPVSMLWYPPTLSTYWLDLEGTRGIEKFEKSMNNRNIQHPIAASFGTNKYVY